MKTSQSVYVIHLATDHAGLELKDKIKVWLQEQEFLVIDHGAMIFDTEDDFPDYVSVAAKAVSLGEEDCRAIIFGGSGNGEAMMANRYPKVRAAVYYGGNPEIVKLSRTHNDANILSLGARFISELEAKEVITTWLETAVLTEEKRTRRNKKIELYTKEIR